MGNRAILFAALLVAACARSEPVTTCGAALQIGAQVLVPAGHVARGEHRFEQEERFGGEGDVGALSVDAHEVTNQQFAAFVDARHYVTVAERRGDDGHPLGAAVFDRSTGIWRIDPDANWRHPEGYGSSIQRRDRYPVVAIAFEDAQAYAHWAGRRLPTENEWEFVSRGAAPAAAQTTTEAFNANGQPIANTWQGLFPFQDSGEDGFRGLAPVGCFRPNPRGLYDTIGNVWEWTSNVFEDGVLNDIRRTEAPPRVLKGGSNLCARNFCSRFRSGSRQPGDPGLGMSHVGFRTVADAPG